MKTIKTILVPTDFTKDAEKAWVYALEVALKTGAKLHLLHSAEEPYDFAVRVEEAVEAATEYASEKFEEMILSARSSEDYKDLSIEYSIGRGKPYGVIMEKARALVADLLIMGTKGEASLKRIIFGNVTSNVILDSEIPVLTVPENSKKPYLDNFLFATDYRPEDMRALQATVYLARALHAKVHILHVSEARENTIDSEIRFRGFKDMVQEKIDYPALTFVHREADRFSRGLSQYVDETKISLVVITRYKKAFLRTLLWANNTQELMYHTHIPMLVLVPSALVEKT